MALTFCINSTRGAEAERDCGQILVLLPFVSMRTRGSGVHFYSEIAREREARGPLVLTFCINSTKGGGARAPTCGVLVVYVGSMGGFGYWYRDRETLITKMGEGRKRLARR